MYLVLSNHFQVDEIVKSFEVAYRSFVVDPARE
jgi:formyltetrahydrofolate hydrolase